MSALKEETSIYLSNFAELERDPRIAGPEWLQQLRKTAIDRFVELGFPGHHNEDWRFTNVASLAKIPFRSTSASEVAGVTQADLQRTAFAIPGARRLAFVNGHFASGLSDLGSLPRGMIVSSMAEALRQHSRLVESHLARHASFEDHAFTALNTALFQDGAFLALSRETVIEDPLYLLFISTTSGEGQAAHPRNLFVLEPGSQVTVVEHHVGLGERVYFNNPVTEVVVQEGAILDHYKVQRESLEAYHVANTQAVVHRGSRFTSQYVALGGGLVRNETRVRFEGEHAEATVNGLYHGAGRQHLDNHTVIDHAKPNCVSHELYKGILDGKAHGVFNGKIFVRQDAQKTDAKQTNKTLLLSDDAVINTKPQLEIFADDVKCTHGATVGQLEEDAVFYLRSRGIPGGEARSLLTFAFANDIISRIRVPAIQTQLEEVLLARHQLPLS